MRAFLYKEANQFKLIFEWQGSFFCPSGKAERKDELWKTTCFEIFLLKNDGSYIEGNFSPNGSWNFYQFSSLRENMAPLEIEAPQIEKKDHQLNIKGALDLDPFHQFNITCVIKDLNGQIEYYALKHSQNIPDFHHPEGFFPLELINS